jgi:HlyD family secretion protein
MDQKIFRKESLENISSPEQLDSLMKVTTPVGWLALVAVGLIIAAVVLWGFWGSIPTTVAGSGLLIKEGGIYDILAGTSGQIYDIRIKPGETVKAGQIVARVSQPELIEQTVNARDEFNVIKKEYQTLKNSVANSNRLNKEYTEMQKDAYLKKIDNAKRQLIWLETKIKDQEALLKEGLITRQELMTTKQQYDGAESDIKQYKSQIEQLSVQKLTNENSNQEKLLSRDQQIKAKEAALAMLRTKHELTAAIVSPYSGQVLSVLLSIGSIVRADSPVLKISLAGKNVRGLSAVIYVTAAEAKMIRPGMSVQISPGNAKKEEYGYMEGRVLSVSQFPTSPEEMMNTLRNDTLVKEFEGKATPLKIYAGLAPAPDSVSGFKWSSPRGKNVSVTEGTRCTAMFIVQEQQPISLVIPLFKKYFYGN